jgi:hypothetical protein
MSDDPAPRDKPWIANKPEDRLKIATLRFLERALVPPFYVVSIHDSDGGGRSDLQRIRDANKGIRSGQLDMDVVQGPHGLARKLELKRGKNKPTAHQQKTIAELTKCGAAPVVAWSLSDVLDGLEAVGFRFLPNTETIWAHWQAQLEAWDRTADLVKSGVIVKKRRPAKAHARKLPGTTWILPT